MNISATAVLQVSITHLCFQLSFSFPFQLITKLRSPSPQIGLKLSKEWGIGDNWNELWNSENDSQSGFQRSLSDKSRFDVYEPTPDEILIENAVDSIYQEQNPSDPPLYDTAKSFESFLESEEFLDEAGKEISMLVRCNESPENILIEEGRKLKPLSDSDRYDPNFLVTLGEGDNNAYHGEHYTPTQFFNDSMREIFNEHARPPTIKKEQNELLVVLDSTGIAAWMSKSLDEKVGLYDKRVNLVLARYSSYATGYLKYHEFYKLYLDVVLSGIKSEKDAQYFGVIDSTYRRTKLKEPDLPSVWRDFKMHGILSPAEKDYNEKQIEMSSKQHGVKGGKQYDQNILFDECEILDWGSRESKTSNRISTKNKMSETDPLEPSSHELVELANDDKTPKRLRDGEFVFIDENSCIGCTRCALTAPWSFKMLENGRARTVLQSNNPEVGQAVAVCPVNCMHKVSFRELKEMESARDEEDGKTDHRHMGPKRLSITPLNVERGCSDANHRSSWYHYLKQKCYTSKSCPQKGCYDCPLYRDKGDNPYFKREHRNAEHIRALSFIQSGQANKHRRFAEL